MTCGAGSGWPFVILALVWHFAQVSGMRRWYVRDFGSDFGRMSCVPWQSVHHGAPLTPLAREGAWPLALLSFTASAWHCAQSGRFGAGSCGNALTSAWQPVHSMGAWTEPENFAASTCLSPM